jgi:metal-responsive CopG/Arc/MetJ family transcriptional regulator
MVRTTVSLPEELLDRLRRIAAEEGTSMAALVRDALEMKVMRYRPRPRSLGMGASGHTDTARRTAVEPAKPRPWR